MIYDHDTYTFYEDNPVFIVNKNIKKGEKKEHHVHSFYQVFYLLKGSMKLRVNKQEYQLHERDIYFVNKYEFHEYTALEDCFLVVYNLDRQFIQEKIPEFDKVRIDFHSFGDNKHEQRFQWVVGILDGMYKEYYKENKYISMGMKAYVFFFCYTLITNYESEETLAHIRLMSKGYHKVLYEVLDYMHEHYLEPLKLQDVAEHFHLTPEYIAKLFKKYFDSTFKKYLDEFKLEKAYCAVAETDELLIDIAYEYGFSSQKSFIRIFEKRFNMTPTQLRNKARRDQKG